MPEDTVMRKFYFALAAVAAVLTVSCAKEIAIDNTIEEPTPVGAGKVSMTFQASAEDAGTKVALDTDGKTAKWEGGEEIAVFDTFGTTLNLFTANSAGTTTSFTGTADGSAEKYVAVYPAIAAISLSKGDKPISAIIPPVQEATLGSFDPAAALYVAESSLLDAKFAFKAAFALLKVNVDVDNVIEVSVENTERPFAGSVFVSTGGGVANGTGTTYKKVTLKKSDDSVLAKGVYYIVVRHLGESSTYTGFKLTYSTSDAMMGERTSATVIDNSMLARKSVLSLGSLSAVPAERSLYAYYQAGNDLVLGEKTYNKAVYGDATLIASGTALSNSTFNNKAKGVYFFEAGGSYSNASELHISTEVIISSTDTDNPAVLTFGSDKAWCLNSGTLVMNGITFDNTNISAGKQSFLVKNATADFDYLAFFNCKSANVKKYLVAFNSNSYNYVVKETVFDHCIFGVASTDSPIIFNPNSANTRVNDFEKFTFSNSVVYNTADANTQVHVFSYYPSLSDELTARTWKLDVVLKNNIFYNIASNNANLRSYKFKSVTITNNIVCCPEYSPSANMKFFTQRVNTEGHGTVVVANNNIAYAAEGTDSKWIVADDAFTTNIGVTKTLEFINTNPLTAADKSTQTFTVSSTYSTYGPQE